MIKEEFNLAKILQQPPGVLIFGGINLFIFGLGSFLLSFFLYVGSEAAGFQEFLKELTEHFPEASLTSSQFEMLLGLQMAIAAFFALSGLGLILRKEAARKATLYFCFFIVVISFLAALLSRGLVGQAVLQIIYPGALIIYFTNKKIEAHFISSAKREEKEQGK